MNEVLYHLRLITPRGVYHSHEEMSEQDATELSEVLRQSVGAASKGQINDMHFHNMINEEGKLVTVYLSCQMVQQTLIEHWSDPVTDRQST